MFKRLIQILPIFFALCCGKVNPSQLSSASTMVDSGEYDSALYVLSIIDTTEFSSHERAYYLLLRNIAKYKLYDPTSSTEELAQCIHMFAENGDRKNLAESYIYRGAIYLDRKKVDDATADFKMAEETLGDMEFPELIIRNKAYLSCSNLRSANYDKALSYAKEALLCAEKNESRRWVGYCLQTVGVAFSRLSETDSSFYYIDKSVSYIYDQPLKEQANYLRNIASCYKDFGLLDKSKVYLDAITGDDCDATVKGTMAHWYTMIGDDNKAETLWKESFATDHLRLKIVYMNEYALWLQSKGRNTEALNYTRDIINMKDSLQKVQQTESIRELQEKHDREVREKESRHTQFMLVMICVVILLILFSILLYNRYKMQKAKKQIAQNNVLIQNFSAQLDELIRQDKQHSKEVRQLTSKIDSLREKQDELLKKGKARYSEITDGGNTAVWRKADFTDFVEYYRILHPEFLYEIELKYSSLPVTNLFYLILHDMGYSDSDAQRILSLSDGALRTMKSRIRKKEKNLTDAV